MAPSAITEIATVRSGTETKGSKEKTPLEAISQGELLPGEQWFCLPSPLHIRLGHRPDAL